MSRLTKEYFDETIRNLVSKQDLERIESAVRNTGLLAMGTCDAVRDLSEQLDDVQEAIEWNTEEVGALSDKSVAEDTDGAFK